MKKPEILNAESTNYSDKAKKILESFAKVDYCDLTYASLKIQLSKKTYDALIVRLRNPIDENLLSISPNLKAIATATTGLNHIDTEASFKKRIKIISLQGEVDFLKNIFATAEYTWALILSLIRKIPFAHQTILEGEWDRDHFIGHELHGKTLGIIGLGRLGSIVAGYARAFGMTILAHTKNKGIIVPEFITIVDLVTLLKNSDIISLHLSLNEETIGFISKPQFLMMEKTPFLINTSRGEIIKEEDLLSALQNGLIKGAALDVLSGEVVSNPLINNPLIEYAKTHDNLIITPHLGGATKESMEKTEIFIAKKIRDFFKKC